MGIGQKRPRSRDWHISGWLAILLFPVALPLAIIAGALSKPAKRTPAEVAGFLNDFLNGAGGDWDWDDFTSLPLDDPALEKLRREADSIALPITPEGQVQLKALRDRAEVLKTAWLKAGQPD